MNMSGWKDIAELIGIAAIVASLIAVAVELRQTQAAILASTYQARAFDGIAAARELFNGDYIAPILARVNMDDPDSIKSLSDVERIRLRMFYISQMVDFDNEFYQYQNGFLDEEYYEHAFKGRLPGTARHWRSLGIVEPRPSFRSFVDEQLKNSNN